MPAPVESATVTTTPVERAISTLPGQIQCFLLDLLILCGGHLVKQLRGLRTARFGLRMPPNTLPKQPETCRPWFLQQTPRAHALPA